MKQRRPPKARRPRVIDLVKIRSERAGSTPIEFVTGIGLIDLDPQTAAEFLAPKSWVKRARWFDAIIADGLTKMVEAPKPISQDVLNEGVELMRRQVTDILNRLERMAPLPLTEDAMRCYRASDDRRRVQQASAFWGSEERELVAMRRLSGCMVLRNLGILAERAAAS